MYLSQLILNPRSRRVQRELADPYQMHRSIMRAFPDGLVKGKERVLFRVDEHPRLGAPALLVQSLVRPDWSWLAEGPGTSGYLLADVQDNPGVKPFALTLKAVQVLAFRLRANPTRRLSAGQGNKGKRVGIYGEEEQMRWLSRKGKQHGFRVLQVRLSGQARIKKHKAIHRQGQAHDLELLSVQFDGLLQVTDPPRLVRAVESGIGSGKGFGFGLLSLASAR